MGWALFEARWAHKCGGRAAPGDHCDLCGAKLKASADVDWNRPKGWTPPGERAPEPAFSIW